ncbi:succinylglutamate desuccinylase/aspartoacylase family protein [Mariniblastus fucicola]|uniref:Aspartoacylase n=1 Tax=Mariniblastus fucicola TaxID=980251 RepID=A0A5B9PBT6_9BACT|nr:succinylglutamate desuccinylase/aspartoacylase family protein [Mariniblastus fucicola]QEG22939.1 aspartoacylase [Mariniblastus fucicola]
MPVERQTIDDWNGQRVLPGESKDIFLAVSESYSGMTVKIPVHVRRAKADGPTIFVTGALHGDEINGTGAIRQLVQDEELSLVRGSVILVPVLNILAFDRHSRYLPDRRDLNRAFPGSETGSLAGRMARTIFDEIVMRCDYGIDLHSASVRRTNYPNVRGDLQNPEVKRIAEAFGCEIIMDGKGPKKALRREACEAGCHTIVMEAGEVFKVEPGIVESSVRGVKNVLVELNMLDQEPESPDYQVTVKKSKWIRAEKGGFLEFHVKPGEVIEKGQPISTNTNLLGRDRHTVSAPFDAVVIGMTTLPAISPGEPICNLGMLPKSVKPAELRKLRRKEQGLEGRVVEELASNLLVVKPELDD